MYRPIKLLLILLLISFKLKALVSVPQSFESITKLFVGNGCDEAYVVSDRLPLSGPKLPANDLIVSCGALCGARQCNYSIYISDKEKDKTAYRYAGEFRGSYTLLKTKHKGYFNLLIRSENPLSEPSQKTIKFNGQIYQ